MVEYYQAQHYTTGGIKTLSVLSTPELFSSTDFYLVAYLMMKGMRLSRIEPRGEGRSIFYLEDHPDRRQLVEEYLQGEALVDPLKYKEAIQRLKSFKHNAY